MTPSMRLAVVRAELGESGTGADSVTYLIGAVKPSQDGARYVAVKIGRSTVAGLDKRLQSLQTGNPFPLEVIAVVPNAAREAKLHHHFAAKRLQGEWFALTRTDIRRVKRAYAPHPWQESFVHGTWHGKRDECPCAACLSLVSQKRLAERLRALRKVEVVA